MRFVFDGSQPYQLRAIEAVADLFAGRPWRASTTYAAGVSGLFGETVTRYEVDRARLLANLKLVQARLPEKDRDGELKAIEESIETEAGPRPAWFPNYSVEMETGTGKTYVYLRTALELNRRYGLCKFIVVVPSVAVREGVLATLKSTKAHLQSLYDNVGYRHAVYDSKAITGVRQFAQPGRVEFLVMTIDSFNRDENVIRQRRDQLNGEVALHLIQATQPVLILDEPQNMTSEGRVRALASLNPLFALRYSATHRPGHVYNLVHRLTPFEAYREGLVKHIEVASVTKEDDHNKPFLRLDEVRSAGSKVQAKIALHKRMAGGKIEEKAFLFNPGQSLAARAERPEYDPYVISEINPAAGTVRFANGEELQKDTAIGADQVTLFREQIRYAVGEHFRKQKRLEAKGVKVLSLFFIDKVKNYTGTPPADRGAGSNDGLYDGVIRELFDEAFDDLKANYPHFAGKTASECRAAYFASKTQRGGVKQEVESREGQGNKEDREAYNLIMRDKGKLLQFGDKPDGTGNPSGTRVAFIFSHSALSEGWDNPNVSQICTLRQVGSETERRQQVGRGMRLVVDQHGKRVSDPTVNILTVIAGEGYERFVEALQREIVQEYGESGAPPKPTNARAKKTVTRRPLDQLPPEFKELWDRIRQKTRYHVEIDTRKLTAEVVAELDKLAIDPPRVVVEKAEVTAAADRDELSARRLTAPHALATLSAAGSPRDVVGMVEDLLAHAEPPIRLTRRTIAAMVAGTKNRKAAETNPQEFATQAARVVRERAQRQLVDGISYEKLDEWYDMECWDETQETGSDKVLPVTRSLYDQVVYQSETERRFAQKLEGRRDVRFFLKLPARFKVQTPVGTYNPDWAVVMDKTDAHGDVDAGEPKLYLVRETKSTPTESELRARESQKILCGRRHFVDALGVDYAVAVDADELP